MELLREQLLLLEPPALQAGNGHRGLCAGPYLIHPPHCAGRAHNGLRDPPEHLELVPLSSAGHWRFIQQSVALPLAPAWLQCLWQGVGLWGLWWVPVVV